MCGLLTFISAHGDAAAHQTAIAQALETLHHRGPDDTGVEAVGDDVVFAHKRLAIIDVAGSREPLSYHHGRYLLTFNGEIYNYIELRRRLIDEFGAEFDTAGDAEVVVAGYHHWGESVLERLRGMFAFLIWDRERRVAFGARDFYGIKPLHYLQTPDGVYFASEKKALLPFADAAYASGGIAVNPPAPPAMPDSARYGGAPGGPEYGMPAGPGGYGPQAGTAGQGLPGTGYPNGTTGAPGTPGYPAGGGFGTTGYPAGEFGTAGHPAPGAQPPAGYGGRAGYQQAPAGYGGPAGYRDNAYHPGMVGDRAIDLPNLSHYLTLQYVPEPRTLHRGINRVGSGESFTLRPGNSVVTRRYYQPRFRPTPAHNPESLYRRIRDTLRESVRLHMRSDVPVGAFLSSGIDSTAVVALAREFNPNILTFTVGFDVPGYSEIEVAQDSARHLGVTTIPTKIGPHEMMTALPKIVWHLDDPVADPALVPLYFVAKKASEYVTVVLSGEGADEFFGGYTIYREPLSLSALTSLPDPMQRGLRKVAQVIPEGVKGRSFLERGTTPIEARYYGNARMFTEEDKQGLLVSYDPRVRYTDVTAPVYAEAADLDDVTKMQYVDLYTWLRGDILVKADRMSMAHSLELRVPFLDREVFEVAATVPVELKLPPRSAETKYALRRALDGVVPPAIVNRKKLGFPTPTRVWLRGEMYEWAQNILAGSGAGHLLNLPYVSKLLDEHRRGEADHSRKVWTVLVFCVWHAIFIERSLDPGVGRNQSALLTKPVVGSMVS